MCEVELSLPSPQKSGEGLAGLGMMYFLGMGVEKVYMHHTTPHVHMYTCRCMVFEVCYAIMRALNFIKPTQMATAYENLQHNTARHSPHGTS